jgi:hypothetical protein
MSVPLLRFLTECACSCVISGPLPMDTAGWPIVVEATVEQIDESGSNRWLGARLRGDSVPDDGAATVAMLRVHRSWKGVGTRRALFAWGGHGLGGCDLELEAGKLRRRYGEGITLHRN